MELNRSGIIDRIQSRTMTIDEFNFDSLVAPPLYSLLTIGDIDKLYNIATSIKYSGNARKKYEAIDNVLKPRGFSKIGSGTNRVVYKFLEDTRFVIKVAADAVGISDNPREFINQGIFKPFVTKVFEVDPTGTVAIVERVIPITSREEFLSVADDVYDVVTNWFLGKYVMADIGTQFFMNYGIRKNFGVVLLDFPYVYELDGNKIFCKAVDPSDPTKICDGEIDYDDGFNFLYCNKCGTRYRVRELARAIKEENIIVKENRRRSKMKVSVRVNGTIISEAGDNLLGEEAKKIAPKEPKKNVVPTGELKVSVYRSEESKATNNAPKKYDNKKKGKNNRNTQNNSSGNNRGVVRANQNVSDKKLATSDAETNNYTAQKASVSIYNEPFLLSEYDAENDLMILKSSIDENYKIHFDTKSMDLDELFSKSQYMQELEIVKADLAIKDKLLETENDMVREDILAIEEALEAEKAENSNLKESNRELVEQNTNLYLEINKLKEELSKQKSFIDSIPDNVSEAIGNAALEEMLRKANNELLKYQDIANLGKDVIASDISDIEFDSYENFTTLHAITSTYNTIAAEKGVNEGCPEFEKNHAIIVFPNGENEYITDAEGNVVAAISVNGIPVDDLIKEFTKKEVDAVPKMVEVPVGVLQQ